MIYRYLGLFIGFLSTYICVNHNRKINDLRLDVDKINQIINRQISFDEKVEIISPLNTERREEKLDSKNDDIDIVNQIINLLEMNQNNFKEDEIKRINNKVNECYQNDNQEEGDDDSSNDSSYDNLMVLIPGSPSST